MPDFLRDATNVACGIVLIVLFVFLILAARRWWSALGEIETLRSELRPRSTKFRRFRP